MPIEPVSAAYYDALEGDPDTSVALIRNIAFRRGDAGAEERRALALELHDTVIQPLTALILSLTCLERDGSCSPQMESDVALWKKLAQEALDSLRAALAGVHSPSQPAASASLPEAIERSLTPQLARRGLRLRLETDHWPSDLPPTWTLNLLLAVREALTNVEKHAHASEASVVLRGRPEALTIIVSDNGIGCRQCDIDSAPHARSGVGFGIRGIRERIRALGGHVSLITAPGCGVRVEMWAPIAGDAEARPDIHERQADRRSPATRAMRPAH